MLLKGPDDQIAEILKSCEQLRLQNEISKKDISNIDFIKCNEVRMQFLKNVKIPVCIQYWNGRAGFKIIDKKDWDECKLLKSGSNGQHDKIKNISSQDIFFSGIPKVMEGATNAEEEAKKKENERKIFRHNTFTSVDAFMTKFFKLPIFCNSGKEPLEELNLISKKYKIYIEKIKEKVLEDSGLKRNAEENFSWINNYLTSKYALYELIQPKVESLDRELNAKFQELRFANFVPKKLDHSVWNKPIKELQWIAFEKSPHKKLGSLVKCLTAVSRAYLLLSDQTDEVTADDILQFSSFIFIKSGIRDLAGYLQYIKAFHYTPSNETQGISQYWFITAESCLEYLKRTHVNDNDYVEGNFEMQMEFETPRQFSMADGNFLT